MEKTELHSDKQGGTVRKSRTATELSQSLDRRLISYGLAAEGARAGVDMKDLLAWVVPVGAMGLGLLGGSEPALAGNIVFTPADITIRLACPSGRTGSCSQGLVPFRGSLAIDLNHDGINDFTVLQTSFDNVESAQGRLTVAAALNGGIAQGAKGAAALSKGAGIGYGLDFKPGPLSMALVHTHFSISNTSKGSWVKRDAFLGLEFQIDGAAHFGWAEFNVQIGPFDRGDLVTLEGYAYDTVAGQGLLAGQTSGTPEPGTLGLLALGSLGLGFWRRKKQETVTSGK